MSSKFSTRGDELLIIIFNKFLVTKTMSDENGSSVDFKTAAERFGDISHNYHYAS